MNSEMKVRRFLVIEDTTGRGCFTVEARDAHEAAGRAIIVAQRAGVPLLGIPWRVHPIGDDVVVKVAQYAEGYFRMLAHAARGAALRSD